MTQQQVARNTSGSVPFAVTAGRGWFAAFGILLIILGFVAIAFPFLTTIAAKIFLGWLFLAGGILQVIHAFSAQRWSQLLLTLLVGAIYVIVGGWLAFFPLAGLITLTVLLAAMFVAQGAVEIGMAFRMRPQTGWIWMLVAGILAIVAGLLIFERLPSSAVWAIGLLVGINMISCGFAHLILSMATSKQT